MLDTVDDTRSNVDQIIDLANPIFSTESSDESVEGAVAAIQEVVDTAIVQQTEALRGALEQMLVKHSRKFTLGRCWCDACQHAEHLLGAKN